MKNNHFTSSIRKLSIESESDTRFELDASRLLEELAEAQAQGVNAKPVIIGPVTYLALGKAKDDSEDGRLPAYGHTR